MRRPRLLAAVAVAAALLGAGLVAAPAVADLAPVRVAFSGDVPARTLPMYGARGMHVLGYQHGARTGVTLTLHNRGPLPVRVTSLGLPTGVAPLLSLEEVRGLPLWLLPGQSREVTATGLLDNCRFTHEREVESHEALRVGLALVGEREREVLLDRPVLVHSPMIVGCPDRQLDRQAADRSDLQAAG